MGNQKLVGNLWEKENYNTVKTSVFPIVMQFSEIEYRDEARHGKGFEGLLKRYFG